MGEHALVMGAVAYDPKVVTIWDGFRAWLRDHDLPFDYVLYSNYERQVDDLVAGRIHAAWNSPLAWVRSRRLGRRRGREGRSDRDARHRSRSDVDRRQPRRWRGLDTRGSARSGGRGRRGRLSAGDASPARPSRRAAGLEPGVDFEIRRFDVGVGLHGDHVGGEREAARALVAGEVDAACMIDGNHLVFAQEGTLPTGAITVDRENRDATTTAT